MATTILITGATGFIGSRLALRCLDEGMEVRALGLRRSAVEQQNARELEEAGAEILDVTLEDEVRLAEVSAGVDTVFHLAAAQHEANVPDQHFRRVNVEGTRNLLVAAERSGVRRFVHGSTIGVYQWEPGVTVGEGSPLLPGDIYGITKLEAEEVVRSRSKRLPFVIARISETYGPGDRRLLKLFRGARRGLCVQIGSGRNLHHLVYIDDLIDGLRLVAREERALGRTLVLAGTRPVTTREMLEGVSLSVGRRPRILRVPLAPVLVAAGLLEDALRPLGVQPPLHRRRMDFFRKSYAFSLETASGLGYTPRVGPDEGIGATARWYAEQGLLSAGG
jgi:nucleoside-diphosphate-sugar epimerase